jgi:hypothetical protein
MVSGELVPLTGAKARPSTLDSTVAAREVPEKALGGDQVRVTSVVVWQPVCGQRQETSVKGRPGGAR